MHKPGHNNLNNIIICKLLKLKTMKVKIIPLIFFLILISIFSCEKKENEITIDQKECLVQIADNWSLVTLDEGPEYLDGGENGFHRNVIGNINYPPEARENGIEGIAIVQYEITIEGRVENILITQDPGTGIGEETKRVIVDATQGIAFSPAILNNNPIRVRKQYEVKYWIV